MKNTNEITYLYNTKFVPQKTRSEPIKRARLLDKLIVNNEVIQPLSLIVAPSGYGKSTLMSQVMEHSVNQGEFVSWLSLDESDNNINTFITYITAAIERVCSADLETVINQSSYPHINHKARLDKLLAQIEKIPNQVKIILDDFHVLTNTELLNHIDNFLRVIPKNLSVFLISKSEPSLKSISEYKVKDRLTEITANELNFTLAETSAFLANKNASSLDAAEIENLQKKTEGWVAATQLIAHAIGKDGQHSEMINNISGTDRDVVKYLGESVLGIQQQAVKDFFLATACLTRFNKELCAALFGDEKAAEILEYIINQGLFIFELDRKRKWFRYHHLFREFLLAELLKQDNAKYQKFCGIAAKWFEQESIKKQGFDKSDYIQEAIDYYLLAEQFDQASSLIASFIVEEVQYKGNHQALLKWSDRLPIEYVIKTPTIAICYIWSCYFTRQFAQGDSLLAKLKDFTSTLTIDTASIDYSIDMLVLIKYVMSGKYVLARVQIAQWFDHWPHAAEFEKGVVCGLMGATCLHTLEYTKARKVLMQGKTIFETLHCDYGVSWVDALYGLVHFQQGNLLESKSIVKRAIRNANEKMGEHCLSSSMLNIQLSQVYLQANNISQATKYLGLGYSFIDIHGTIDTPLIGFTTKAKLLQYEGKLKEALQLLHEGESFGRRMNFHGYEAIIVSKIVKLLLTENNNSAATELYIERGLDQPLTESHEYTPYELITIKALQARMALAKREPEITAKLLNELVRECRQKHFNYLAMQLLLLNASAHFQQGKVNIACRLLNQVIESSAIDNNLGLFISEAYHLTPLLCEYLAKQQDNISTVKEESIVIFIQRLRKLFVKSITDEDAEIEESTSPVEAKNSQVVEQLTKRERELLSWLKQGLSNKQLAENMFVSESTIKWHLSRIYIKIGAKNRLEAINTIF